MRAESSHVEPSHAPGPADRDRHGRFVRGNRAALIVGAHSVAFWEAHTEKWRQIVAAVIVDAGYTLDDAPRALRLAAESIAQGTLLRDSAFEHIVASGGPLTAKGHARRAYQVWLTASERVHRGLTLVGLRRVPRPAPSSFAEAILDAPEVGR